MNKLAISLSGAALLLTLACGGGGGGASGTPATRLAYADPVNPGDTWRLVQDPASTATHVVLDLLAPSGTSGNGFTVTLATTPGQAAWAKVDGTNYAVQTLFATPKVNLAKLSSDGRTLRILVGQAPTLTGVDYGSAPAVVQVALDKGASAVVGGVTLTASAAGNLGTDPTPVAVTVALGSLTAQ